MFARMPGVFEPCTMAGPSGAVTVPCLSKPCFLVARIARKLLGDGSVWILVTSGSLNSNSTRVEPAWFPSLCPVVMHSPVTGLFRVPGSVSSSHHPSPLQEQRTTGHTQSASIQHCNVWSDGLCAKTLGKYCRSCTS